MISFHDTFSSPPPQHSLTAIWEERSSVRPGLVLYLCCLLLVVSVALMHSMARPNNTKKNTEFMWGFFLSVRSLIQFTFAYHFTDFHKTSRTILPVRLLLLSNVAKIDLLVPNLLGTGQCDCKNLRNQGKRKKKMLWDIICIICCQYFKWCRINSFCSKSKDYWSTFILF